MSTAALRMMGGHAWTTEGEWADQEVVSHGARNAAVCEVGHASDFGTIENYRKEIVLNRIEWDPNAATLSYASNRAATLYMDTSGLRKVDEAPVDMAWKTYDCPFLQSDWGSGVVTFKSGSGKMILDFLEARRK